MQLDVFWANDIFTVCLICVRMKAVTGVSEDSVLREHHHLPSLRLCFPSLCPEFSLAVKLFLAAILFPSLLQRLALPLLICQLSMI